jgi:hypothetical protein
MFWIDIVFLGEWGVTGSGSERFKSLPLKSPWKFEINWIVYGSWWFIKLGDWGWRGRVCFSFRSSHGVFVVGGEKVLTSKLCDEIMLFLHYCWFDKESLED